MDHTVTAGREVHLGDGLVLRTVRDESDIDRYAAFHATVTSESEGATCAQLLHYHPEMRPDDFQLVEDVRGGEIASTTCLIPWHCQIEDIDMDVAMLEMVATHPEYRHRGLIRTQMERFHGLVRDRGFDLSIIQGIPYYYRQYGYAYACDHQGHDSFLVSRLPDGPTVSQDRYVLRPAGAGDVPLLTRFYDKAMEGVQIRTSRRADYWRFLLERQHYPVKLVEDTTESRAVGYVVVFPGDEHWGPSVAESWAPNYEVAVGALRLLAPETACEMQIGWPESGLLVKLARSNGGKPRPVGQWLLRITDVGAFLRRLGPLFEQRLSAGGFADLTADVRLNLFREAFVLRFASGRLRAVEAVGFVDASMGAKGVGDLCIPPDAFVRLILGYRDLDVLRDAWPDIIVEPASRKLLEVLLPRMSSHFSMPYHLFSPLT